MLRQVQQTSVYLVTLYVMCGHRKCKRQIPLQAFTSGSGWTAQSIHHA